MSMDALVQTSNAYTARSWAPLRCDLAAHRGETPRAIGVARFTARLWERRPADHRDSRLPSATRSERRRLSQHHSVHAFDQGEFHGQAVRPFIRGESATAPRPVEGIRILGARLVLPLARDLDTFRSSVGHECVVHGMLPCHVLLFMRRASRWSCVLISSARCRHAAKKKPPPPQPPKPRPAREVAARTPPSARVSSRTCPSRSRSNRPALRGAYSPSLPAE